jgi:hypothetical protein
MFDVWTAVAIVLLALILFGLFRPAGKREAQQKTVAAEA